MPTKRAKERAEKDKRAGKKPTTQAGEFVREEMHKMKRGGGRAKNPKQAIAIGLSEARREGVKVGENPNRKRAKKSSSSRTSSRSSTAKKSSPRSKSAASTHKKTARTSRKKTSARKSTSKR